eukprot:CAMPEP_0177669544 /NCGR_PEP_ID=MMETSP0447-20121125/23515_1 /TAXON_ID=0 /ORGANISM="Stygamoeba regulata, Strain BSH-02190019" /LENGTH=299 /DNA_ID=CAMNT_0019176453 /DNA_START=86 /DNA_END=985 /DNA_ORIENTATION=+
MPASLPALVLVLAVVAVAHCASLLQPISLSHHGPASFSVRMDSGGAGPHPGCTFTYETLKSELNDIMKEVAPAKSLLEHVGEMNSACVRYSQQSGDVVNVYIVCVGRNITQISGGNTFLVGKYEKVEADFSQIYGQGDFCGNLARSATLRFKCLPQIRADELVSVSVSEPQMCHYSFEVGSSIFCKHRAIFAEPGQLSPIQSLQVEHWSLELLQSTDGLTCRVRLSPPFDKKRLPLKTWSLFFTGGPTITSAQARAQNRGDLEDDEWEIKGSSAMHATTGFRRMLSYAAIHSETTQLQA